MTREETKAVQRVLETRIDSENYGMFATKKYSWEDAHILNRANIHVSDNEVFQDGVIVFRIKRNYSSVKRDGMYKQLKPTLIPV